MDDFLHNLLLLELGGVGPGPELEVGTMNYLGLASREDENGLVNGTCQSWR